MKNTILVMRQEIIHVLRSTGYVIFAFLLPVAAVLITGMVKLVQAKSVQETSAGSTASAPVFQLAEEGFVDQSGWIKVIPPEFQGSLFAYEDEEQAKKALGSGQITAYYVIPRDYLETGIAYYVYPDTRSYLSDGQDWVIAKTLMFNLLGSEEKVLDRVWNPIRLYNETNIGIQASAEDLPPDDCLRPGGSCKTNALVRYLPSIMTALFFGTFMTSSSMLFTSVSKEKENRVIEVLLLSVRPRQLLAGKTFGLGFAGLLQTLLWLGAFYLVFNMSGSTLRLPENFVFPVDILVWGVVFFLGGYGLYANLMAGAGALVPTMKEAGVASYIAISPMFLGYAFGLMAPLTGTADSPFLVFLGYFPLTSPLVMVMRLTNSSIPFWQPLIAAALLFATAWFCLRASAAVFHARNLLSGQPFSLGRYLTAMVGR